MKTINRSISDLKPYENNTKKHDAKQIENVANSIKEFGFEEMRAKEADGGFI